MKAPPYPPPAVRTSDPEHESAHQSTAGTHTFPLGFSERRLLLAVGDVLLLAAAGVGAVLSWAALRTDVTPTGAFVLQQAPWLLGLSAAWLVLWAIAGGYDLRISAAGRPVSSRLAATALTFGIGYVLLFYVFAAPPALLHPVFPSLVGAQFLRVVPTLFVAYALLGELLWRNLYARMLTGRHFQRRTLVVGAGWAGQTIAQALCEYGDGSYALLGFVDDDPAKSGAIIETHIAHSAQAQASDREELANAVPVLGDCHSLPDLIAKHNVSTLVLAITHELSDGLLPILMDCLELGIEIIPMPVLYERLTGRVPVEHIGNNWYVAVPIYHRGTSAVWPFVKRSIDLVVACIGLACFSMVLPFLALAIALDSRGPIFYGQERVGKGGRVFRVFKLRSMVQEAENGRPLWAQRDDPRVTRVGRILRKTHLDELPQLLNILKGDMSVVGPRPERPVFAEELARQIPFYRVRHAVKPGAAGWALVNQGYGASTEDALLKLQYDLYYIKHQSLWLDLLILIRTGIGMLTLQGR